MHTVHLPDAASENDESFAAAVGILFDTKLSNVDLTDE
jgi:hypothetical protein